MTSIQDWRANQIEQGELWGEIKVEHTWIHLVRGMVKDGEIAKLGRTAFCVYVAIKAHTDFNTGNAWPSIELLASQVGVSDDTAERALKKLTKAGLLTIEKRGRSNVYSVIEKIQLNTPQGESWGTGERKYISSKYMHFVEELKRLANTGNAPNDRAITINVSFNVQNITQAENGTVNVSVQNNNASEDHLEAEDRLRNLLRRL